MDALASAREAFGISQRELSAKLKRPHSFVYLVEKGNRMLNSCEFIEFALAVNADPAKVMDQIVKGMGKRRKR
jgi:ribosome-binding protein aMBF1 (putative translation factor)